MYEIAIAATYGAVSGQDSGGCFAIFECEDNIDISYTEIVNRCLDGCAEWLVDEYPEEEGNGYWELPEGYDYNFGDMLGMIWDNEDLRVLLKSKYGIEMKEFITTSYVFYHDDYVIPYVGSSKDIKHY